MYSWENLLIQKTAKEGSYYQNKHNMSTKYCMNWQQTRRFKTTTQNLMKPKETHEENKKHCSEATNSLTTYSAATNMIRATSVNRKSTDIRTRTTSTTRRNHNKKHAATQKTERYSIGDTTR
jgi:hypothetical protein